MAELKPCPFCGGNDVRQTYYDPFDGYQGDCGSYLMTCADCGARVQRRTVEEVLKAWNRRAEDVV